jgi:prepilin-type N-terminal cleavage/methylation domain-containing protein
MIRQSFVRSSIAPRAFTLIEMMVVLTVSLLLMTMIVPVFKVSTKTVQVIERKLAVYEAARNTPEIIEAHIRMGVTNERGGQWSIKHVSWLDTDPFTPASPTPPLDPGITDTASMAYKQSRRISDSVAYVRLEGGGIANSPSQFAGSKMFPLSYPAFDFNYPECWRASMRSTLLYQHPDAGMGNSSDYETDQSGTRWNRPEQLADVSTSELAFIFYAAGDQWRHNGSALQHFDPIPDQFGPGQEIRVPVQWGGNTGAKTQRRLAGIKIMDLDVSYWDDSPTAGGGKQFKTLPDNSVVYFWPPPKAIRVTITVCDREKRDTLTLCRVVQIPVGLGNGTVNAAAMDASYSAPATFNRTKNLATLPVYFNGDPSYGGMPDAGVSSTEAKIIQSDGVKPINFP